LDVIINVLDLANTSFLHMPLPTSMMACI